MFLLQAWRSAAFGIYGFKNFTRQGFQEHSKKFRQEDMQVQMEGKNCIITGANSGIGYAVAEGLASRGATVYMVCRSKERGEAALSKIQSSTGNANVYLEVCDLSSMADIKSFASRFSSMDKPVHVLVNNAGILEHKYVTTSEGLELNFAVNVAGTYAMTELMVPLLKRAAPDARVITVSSGGMYTVPLTKDLQFKESNFDGTRQYAQNKRAQLSSLVRSPAVAGRSSPPSAVLVCTGRHTLTGRQPITGRQPLTGRQDPIFVPPAKTTARLRRVLPSARRQGCSPLLAGQHTKDMFSRCIGRDHV